MMACVTAMQNLALRDIDSMVSSDEKWTHPDYPGVYVSVIGEGRTSKTYIKVRWAMFLINGGIKDMLVRQRYELAVYYGYYQSVKVGTAIFWSDSILPPIVPPTTAVAARAITEVNQTQISFERNGSGNQTALATGEKLDARVEYLDKAMDRRDTIIMIVYLMLSLASRNKEPLGVYHQSLVAVTVEVRTIWTSHPAAPHYYMTTGGDMINMLAQLATVIIRERRYAEMNVIIYDEGVVIARGAIRTKPLPPKQDELPETTDTSSS